MLQGQREGPFGKHVKYTLWLQTDTCLQVHSSIIHNNKKVQITQVSISGWRYQQNVIPAYNEYNAHKECWNSALTMSEILIHVTTWMTLKTCEISPSQKAKHHVIPLCRGAYSIQIHRATKWIMVAKGWAKRGMGSQCFTDTEVRLRVMTKLWRWMVVMAAVLWMYSMSPSCAPKNDSNGEAYVTYILPQ